MKSTRALLRVRALVCALAFAPAACGILDDDDTGASGETTGDTSDTGSDDAPDPPDQGFRVLPKYMLVDVSAVVTLDDDGMAVPCPFDDGEGAYLCDTAEIAAATATIRVERDGFETAVRQPAIVAGQLETLEVHLVVEGGSSAAWSGCVAAGEQQSCDDLCDAMAFACAVTSCATEDPEAPVATFQTFPSLDCLDAPIASEALACGAALPGAEDGVASLRCCCAA